jgi:predicted acetyltransferase
MFVQSAYRRQGIARALLSRMLADDRDAGAAANVLLASHTGSKLYQSVGYETLGTLYMFTPPKEATQQQA